MRVLVSVAILCVGIGSEMVFLEKGRAMIKKLLILVLVLGTGSFAGAALRLDIPAEEMYIGATVTIGIVSGDDLQYDAFLLIEDTDVVDVSGYRKKPIALATAEIVPDGNWVIDGWLVFAIYNSDPAFPGPVRPGVGFVFDILAVERGTVAIQLLEAAGEVVDTAILTIYDGASSDCYTGPDYDEWVLVGRPASWCNPRQCEGDASGSYESNPFTGHSWWVGVDDLGSVIAGWKKQNYTNPDECWWIAGDFDHRAESNPFTGESWRVGVGDLNILIANWKHDTNIKADCLD